MTAAQSKDNVHNFASNNLNTERSSSSTVMLDEEEALLNPRTLIVDDEPFNLIALEGLLQLRHFTNIDKAYNGKEALGKLVRSHNDKKPYELVILDKNMPLLGGLDTATEIRKLQKAKVMPESLKVVLMTGDYAFKSNKGKVFDHVLMKPFD